MTLTGFPVWFKSDMKSHFSIYNFSIWDWQGWGHIYGLSYHVKIWRWIRTEREEEEEELGEKRKDNYQIFYLFPSWFVNFVWRLLLLSSPTCTYWLRIFRFCFAKDKGFTLIPSMFVLVFQEQWKRTHLSDSRKSALWDKCRRVCFVCLQD